MASNKKADDERGVVWAEVELRWYYGQGASTAVGDMGQRSSLGSQLARAAAGSKPRRRRKGPDGEYLPDEAIEVASGAGGSSAVGYIDVDAIERRMTEGIGAVARIRLIESALTLLSPTFRSVLRLAYGDQRDRVRFNISQVVTITAEARRAAAKEVGRAPTESEIDQAVIGASGNEPWLTKARVAADLLTKTATADFAEALAKARDEERSHNRVGPHPGFWQWRDFQGRKPVGR